MRRILIRSALFISVIAYANIANATVERGQSFYEKWVQSDYGKKDAQIYQYLIGYVAGMYDAVEGKIYYCVGENVKMSSLVDAVGKYLEDNPRVRQYPVAAVFEKAVKEEWKCQ